MYTDKIKDIYFIYHKFEMDLVEIFLHFKPWKEAFPISQKEYEKRIKNRYFTINLEAIEEELSSTANGKKLFEDYKQIHELYEKLLHADFTKDLINAEMSDSEAPKAAQEFVEKIHAEFSELAANYRDFSASSVEAKIDSLKD